MITIATIAFVISVYVLETSAIKCYVGFSAADLPLAMAVRDVQCGPRFDHCVSLKYKMDGLTITQGNCANKYGQVNCHFMGISHRGLTECHEELCHGDHCNSAVYEAEQVERKRVGPYNNTLKCTTGLQTSFPDIPFAAPDVPYAVDECFPGTKECVTIQFDYLYQFESKIPTTDNQFTLPIIQKICNRPYVACDETWCTLFGVSQSMGKCKATCCTGDNCNA